MEVFSYMAKRGLAYGLDCLCGFLVFVITQFLIFRPLASSLFGIEDDWFKSGLNAELYTLLTISSPVWLYFILFESSQLKATPGKMIMGFKVYAYLEMND